jgi:hypothetical protein
MVQHGDLQYFSLFFIFAYKLTSQYFFTDTQTHLLFYFFLFLDFKLFGLFPSVTTFVCIWKVVHAIAPLFSKDAFMTKSKHKVCRWTHRVENIVHGGGHLIAWQVSLLSYECACLKLQFYVDVVLPNSFRYS